MCVPLKVKAVNTKENSLTTTSRQEDFHQHKHTVRLAAQNDTEGKCPKKHLDHLEI